MRAQTSPVATPSGAAAHAPVLAAAIGTIALAGVALSLSVALIAIRMERAGYSSASIGLSTAMAGVGNIAIAPLVPRIARRLGPGATLGLSLAVGGISLLAFAATPIALWFGLRVFYGAALTVLFVMSEFWIMSVAPAARRGLVMGLYAIAMSIGFAAGPLLLGVTGIDDPWPFLAGTGFFVVAAIPAFLARANVPILERASRVSIRVLVRTVTVAAAAAFVFGTFESASMSLFPVYALRIGLPVQVGAGLVSLSAIGGMVFQVPLGLIGDRVPRPLLLVLCGIAGTAGAAGMMVAGDNAWMLGAVVLAWGGIATGLYTVGLALVADRHAGADLAGANASLVTLYALGATLAPPVLGRAMDLSSASILPVGLLAMFASFAVLAGRSVLKVKPALSEA